MGILGDQKRGSSVMTFLPEQSRGVCSLAGVMGQVRQLEGRFGARQMARASCLWFYELKRNSVTNRLVGRGLRPYTCALLA